MTTAALADTASEFLQTRDARAHGRALLEADENLPPFWDGLVALGWLGLHLPEEYGGSGYGMEELVVVVEELGRAVAPGPFVPTVIASAVIDAAADDAAKAALLPGWPTGRRPAASRPTPTSVSGRNGSARSAVVLGGGLADAPRAPAGDDVGRRGRDGAGVTVDDAPQPRPDPPQSLASRSTSARPRCSPVAAQR